MEKTFSAFEDFDSSKLLNEIEGELIPQIVDKLVTDSFPGIGGKLVADGGFQGIYDVRRHGRPGR